MGGFIRQLWLAPEIRRIYAWRPGVPETELMRLFWKEQKSCRSMIVVMPDFGKEDFYEEIGEEADCLRQFLGEDYGALNGLLLISRVWKTKRYRYPWKRKYRTMPIFIRMPACLLSVRGLPPPMVLMTGYA